MHAQKPTPPPPRFSDAAPKAAAADSLAGGPKRKGLFGAGKVSIQVVLEHGGARCCGLNHGPGSCS